MLRALSLLFISYLLLGCSEEPNVDSPTETGPQCPTEAVALGNDETLTINPGERVANRFRLNGTVLVNGEILYLPLTSLSLYIGSTNLTDIEVNIYERTSGGLITPENGDLVSTINETLDGSTTTSISDPIVFELPTPLNMRVGPTYYYVVSATGGSFDIAVNTTEEDLLVGTEIWEYNGSSWSSGDPFVENLSTTMTYNECFFEEAP